MMTSKERCLAVLNHNKPDRTPFFPLMMFFAADRAKVDYRTYSTDANALIEAQLNLYENYMVDAVTVSTDSYRLSADLGGEMDYPLNATPHLKTPLISCEDDFKKLSLPDVMKKGSRTRNRIETIEGLSKHLKQKALITGWVEMPFAEVADWLGVEEMMYMLYDEPEFVHQMLDFAADIEIEFAKAQIAAGADLIGCGDAAASLISAALFEEFALPYQKKVASGIRAAGAYSKLHICGNTNATIHLMAQNGVDLVNIDSMTDFDKACEVFTAANMAFKGNASPVDDLADATPQHAENKGLELLEKAKGKNFMLSCGCEIPAKTPDETYFAFAKTVLK